MLEREAVAADFTAEDAPGDARSSAIEESELEDEAPTEDGETEDGETEEDADRD